MAFRASRSRAAGQSVAVPESDSRAIDSQLAGWHDALEVATGARVVRAILAHYGVQMFPQIWPELDLDQYLIGYGAAPESQPPPNQRKASPPMAYTGPRRRTEDYQ